MQQRPIKLPKGELFRIRLDVSPSDSSCNYIASQLTEAVKNAPSDVVPFIDFYPQKLWSGDSRRNICAPIGVAGAKDQLQFLLGMYSDGSYEPSHALLAGATGSGKSYSLHAIILSLALQYSPQELEFYLLDYKEGVEFQTYITPDEDGLSEDLNSDKALPHARVIAIESDPEFGLSVLKKVIAEIESRSQLFKSVGVSGIEAYRNKTEKTLPRLLIAIDEYQQIYIEADSRLCDRLNDAFETIAKQGRSFGVHLLLCSQSPRITDFRERIYEQMAVRMAMKMARSTIDKIMADNNTKVVDSLDRAGRLAYNDKLGEKDYNLIGQVAFVNLEARRAAMNAILEESQQSSLARSTQTFIFNGIRNARLQDNTELLKLFQCNRWMDFKEINQSVLQERRWTSLEQPCATWVGESMRIGRHVRLVLKRRSRCNLAIIGGSEYEIFGILGSLLLGLVYACPPEQISFQIIDLSLSEEEDLPVLDNFTRHFKDIFQVNFGKRFITANDDRNTVKADVVWQLVCEEFSKRVQMRSENPDMLDFGKTVFFIFALGSLSQMDRFRPVAGRIGDEMSPDAKKLLEIVSQGPELGIKVVLWLGDVKSLQTLFANNRSALSNFDHRICLRLNDRDSQDFLGENIAKHLKDTQAYYNDISTPDIPEKFRTYAHLSDQEIEKYAQNLKTRKSRKTE